MEWRYEVKCYRESYGIEGMEGYSVKDLENLSEKFWS